MTPPSPKPEFFYIDRLIIRDKDRNDIFDPKVDEVIDHKGRTLRPDSHQVKKVLSDMGIGKVKGLRLSSAAQFAQSLREAEYYSNSGDPDQVKAHLSLVESAAKELKISYPKTRAEKLLKTAYEKGLSRSVQSAKLFAEMGNVEDTRRFLNQATEYATKLEKDYGVKPAFDKAEADKILHDVSQKAISQTFDGLESLIHTATSDPVALVQKDLDRIEEYAFEAGIPFNYTRADDLIDGAKAKAVEILLDQAEKNVTDRKALKETLSQIAEYAAEAGVTPDPERVDALKKYLSLSREIREEESRLTGYGRHDVLGFERLKDLIKGREALGEYIQTRNALRDAVNNGEVEKVEELFEEVGDRASELEKYYGIDVGWDPEKWQEMDLAVISKRIQQDFKTIELEARTGSVDRVEELLAALRDRCLDWGVDMDETRENAVREKAYEARLQLTYAAATIAAQFGDKKGCLKSLSLAQDYAKEMGVPFDKKRADEIRKSISKHRVFPMPLTPSLLGGRAAGGVFSIPTRPFTSFPGGRIP